MDYKKNIKDMSVASHGVHDGVEAFNTMLPKKCERLSTAVYLVTNFLSDNEPIKYRLRTLSLDFVRDAFLVKNSNYIIEQNVLDGFRANILETLSLLELAFVAGLVSEMNFTILKREYTSLRSTIELKKTSRESRTNNILGDNFFGLPISQNDIPQVQPSFENRPLQTFSNLKGHSIGHSEAQLSDRSTKGQISVPKVVQEKFAPSVRVVSSVAKESRSSRILKLIKDNKEVTIKDIAVHFVDLSEKTIQRELIALVESGVLKKIGERRWSRYALV